MRRRDLLRGRAATAAASAARVPLSASAASDTQRRRRFPNLPLITQEGRAVRLYSDLIEGKTVVFHFMYTTCTGSCPLTTANLARVRDLLGARVGRDLFLYSVSVDPSYDTPERLRAYAQRFGATPGWRFLTGRDDDIATLRRRFGDDPSRALDGSNHLNLFSYGVEPLQRWGTCAALLDPKWVVRYISWLDPKGERPNGWWPPGRVVQTWQREP
jgi:protein SCO1/2